MKLATPCFVMDKVPNSNGYIGVTLDGPGQGARGKRKGRRTTAHRAAWEAAHGPIPAGLFVLHHCDNRACSNLEHLYLGTHADNMRDVRERGRAAKPRLTCCKRGHPFTPENTYVEPKGTQLCRLCKALRQRRRYHGRVSA